MSVGKHTAGRRPLGKLALLLALAMVVSAFAVGPLAGADEYTENVYKSDHKVKNKWDHSGTIEAHPGYNWGGLAEGATWTYKVHVKEAMNGDYSVGTIHFSTTTAAGLNIDVVGHVDATRTPFTWSGDPVRAATGTADFDGQTWYFMFMEQLGPDAMWFVLSATPTYPSMEAGHYSGFARAYQLHSINPGTDLTLDMKEIH